MSSLDGLVIGNCFDDCFPIINKNLNIEDGMKPTRRKFSVKELKIQRSENCIVKEVKQHTRAKDLWKLASCLILKQKDPWETFHIENLQEEQAKRWRYNAVKSVWVDDIVHIKLEDKPFNHGAMRECFRAKKLSNFLRSMDWSTATNCVAKRYIENVDRSVYFDDVCLQMNAKLWGEEYSRQQVVHRKVDIAQMCVLELSDRSDKPLYHLENFIDGTYRKYNSNSGFVDTTTRNTPQAFSHFTFERSAHCLMVVDIQGVGDLWTDPQIHTFDGKLYGDGNLGIRGMALFFYTHRCNPLCKALKLSQFDLPPATKNDSINDDNDGVVSSNETDRVNSSPQHSDSLSSIQFLPFKHRSSCVTEVHGEDAVILGSIHHELARLHASGRLNILDKTGHYPLQLLSDEGEELNAIRSDPKINWESVLFHENHAADLGNLEAIQCLAQYYLDLPINGPLDQCRLKPSMNYSEMECMFLGLNWMTKAALAGDRDSLIYLALRNHDGSALCGSTPDWLTSMHWFEILINNNKSLINSDNDSASSKCDFPMDWPLYRVHGIMAEMYAKGGYGLDKNSTKAFELYELAAEGAMEARDGRLAAKYFDCASQLENSEFEE